MSTVLLFTCLLALAYTTYRANGRKLLSPSVIYSTVFAISLAVGLTEYRNWDFTIHWNTFFLILLSSIVFSCCGLATENANIKKQKTLDKNNSSYYIAIAPPILVCLAIIQFLVYIAVYHSMYLIVKNYRGRIWIDRTSVIGVYDQLLKFSDTDISLPLLISVSFLFCGTVGFTLVYVLSNNFLVKHKSHESGFVPKTMTVLLLVNIFLSLFGTILSGGRTNFIFFVIGSAIIFALIYFRVFEISSIRITARLFLILILSALFIVSLFFMLLKLVGRTIKGTSITYYFAWYVGAPVKNLDIYMQTPHHASRYFGSMSFRSIYRKLGYNTPNSGLTAFQQINGHQLGNVYTVLGDLYYDFGFWGALLGIAILSIVIHSIYRVALGELTRLSTCVAIITYGYLMRAVALVFFANQFSTAIGSFGFILRLIIWIIIPILFFRYKQTNKPGKLLNMKETRELMFNTRLSV